MKKITILLSSALTLLLITSNNASAAFAISNAVFADQPNKNSSTGFNPKRNRLGDDISGYGYKNILKKGNVFKGNVRIPSSSNRLIGLDVGPVGSDQAIMTRPYRLGEDVGNGTPLMGGSSSWRDSGKVEVENSRQNWGYRVNERKYIGENGKAGFIGTAGKDGVLVGQEGEVFNPTSKYSISDEPAFIPKPDAVGKAGFIVGPIGKEGFIGETGKDGIFVQDVGPIGKGVPLKFINGEWIEDLTNSQHNLDVPMPMPGDYN